MAQHGIAQQADGHPDVVLRDAPGSIHIVAQVPNGQPVTILQRHGDPPNDQLQVQWNAVQGWAKATNIRVVAPTPALTPPGDPNALQARFCTREKAGLIDAILHMNIPLLRGDFLVDLSTRGEILPRRQEVPVEGFVHGDRDVLTVCHIVVVSLSWLSRAHPDPQGDFLRQIVDWLRTQETPSSEYAFFIDYPCLHQAPRNPEEQGQFVRALRMMPILFAHDEALCLVLDGPLPAHAENARPHNERGWSLFQDSVAALKANPSHLLLASADFRPYAGTRLSPDDFRTALANMTFAGGAADRGMVERMYERVFWIKDVSFAP